MRDVPRPERFEVESAPALTGDGHSNSSSIFPRTILQLLITRLSPPPIPMQSRRGQWLAYYTKPKESRKGRSLWSKRRFVPIGQTCLRWQSWREPFPPLRTDGVEVVMPRNPYLDTPRAT